MVSLIETYQYHNCSSWITQEKGLTKLSGSCSVADNGLMYDNCEGGTGNWSSANSYCSSKGMRLPKLNETSSKSGNGVPSCSSWTWTSTNSGQTYDHLDVWNGTSQNYYDDDNSHSVRCVR